MTTISLSTAILNAAALSFLGLGAQPPAPAWGGMLSIARSYMDISPWLASFRVWRSMIAVLGFNFLGDGLRDISIRACGRCDLRDAGADLCSLSLDTMRPRRNCGDDPGDSKWQRMAIKIRRAARGITCGHSNERWTSCKYSVWRPRNGR